jgi:hypothetical protein
MMEQMLDPKLAEAKEAGSKIHDALHGMAKLIENSTTEEEARALWDAFIDAVDPDIGEGASLCIKDVWRFVDWYKVNWAPKDQMVIRKMKMKLLRHIEKN